MAEVTGARSTLVCRRDGATTRLRCAQCDVGICPSCLVRTPIGYKCPGCAGEGGAAQGRRSGVGLRAVACAALLAVVVGGGLLRSWGGTASDPVPVPSPVAETGTTRQAMIGDEARDGQLVFVVDDFSCDAERGSSDTGGTPVAGKLCTLRFTVRNASSSPAMLLGRFQYLVDAQSRTYGADDARTRAASANGDRGLSDLNINPEVVLGLVFVFDVPTTVDPIEAQFRGTGRSRFGVNVRLERRGS